VDEGFGRVRQQLADGLAGAAARAVPQRHVHGRERLRQRIDRAAGLDQAHARLRGIPFADDRQVCLERGLAALDRYAVVGLQWRGLAPAVVELEQQQRALAQLAVGGP
jgi:hypothetical protein